MAIQLVHADAVLLHTEKIDHFRVLSGLLLDFAIAGIPS